MAMICINISPAAFAAIAATLPLGSGGFEREADSSGEIGIWLPESVVNRLRLLRGPGESYSDVILRLAAGESGR